MLIDLPIPSTLKPIQRSTASDRLAVFQKNSNSIYNKYTPFTNLGIGPSQPFVYTKISDSTFSKNLTKYDSFAFPIGSTVRDLKRVGQFVVTGNGLLYNAKQLFLQKQNAFNETRIFNPLSTLKATARPGALGLIDYPQRHLETSGGIFNFFADALMSTLGMSTMSSQQPVIQGTATGPNNAGAFSLYAGKQGGARAGVMRLGTATKAIDIFESTWVTNPSQSSTKGGFLSNLAKGLVNKLKSLIPSTNPLGAFGGEPNKVWIYRPEYQKGKDGAYYAFLADNSGYLKITAPATPLFYNGKVETGDDPVKKVQDFHKYAPAAPGGSSGDYQTARLYASKTDVADDTVGMYGNNIKNMYDKMLEAIESPKLTVPQQRGSAERYNEVKDKNGVSYPTYKDIPDKNSPNNKYYNKMINANVLAYRKFPVTSKYSDIKKGETSRDSEDSYNTLEPISVKGLDAENGKEPFPIAGFKDDSTDIIFFYFYDIINEVYVPFRAVIKGISDQHQAEWEDVSYIGRADKLFLYKGFTRDVSFSFTVYANSAKEMLPMWERINYLVGLTRPSKYTSTELSPAAKEFNASLLPGFEDFELSTTGREGKFIYPPMTKFRLGDMYVDQPCIISSVGINVSDEANWESFRSDNYEYLAGPNIKISQEKVKSRQLPLQVDVSINLKILEKALSLGSNSHFGKTTYDASGGEATKWNL